MTKSFVLLCCIALFSNIAHAQHVTPAEARQVAVNFYLGRLPADYPHNVTLSDFSQPAGIGSPVTLYYIINVSNGGYIIVSADKRIKPVIAYSFEGNFDAGIPLPCNVGSWMRKCEGEIRLAMEGSEQSSPDIISEWNYLLSTGFFANKSPLTIESVSPLLVSKWNQPWPYNGMCPADPAGPHGHCVTGCVATAMGQLLYYYRFPYMGQGAYSYVHPDYGTISANFDTTAYDWNGMNTAPTQRNDAIALLLFHQGVSVDMDYGPNSSGMWNHKAAYSLKNHFRYGPETQYYFRDSITLDWDSILIANLNQRKPLYYAGWEGVQSNSGHAFVCDGYQGTDYFHFNWGWGGSYDGYFYLNALNPGGSNFNYAQEVIPLFPDTLLNTYPQYPTGQTIVTSLNGSIEDGSGWFPYHNNTNASWLIAPHDPETDSITSIKLTFRSFETEVGSDVVTVYDGDNINAPVLGTFSGSSLPPVINSTSDRMLIVFQTDGNNNFNGWIADYESILPVYCSGTATMTTLTGFLSDGSGNKNYSNNQNCRWKIMPPNATQTILTFTSFETADSNDFVRILDIGTQAVLGTFYGNQVPPPIVSSGKMMVLFSTNDEGKAAGWEAYYSSSLQDVTVNEENPVKVYPNPASNLIYLSLFSGVQSTMAVNIRTSSGVSIFNRQYQINSGMNFIELDITGIGNSIYFLSTESGGIKQVMKLVICH